MDIKLIFGKNLQKYRKSSGLSQEGLAEKLNTSFQHISNIENGRNFISAELLEGISEVLNISPATLFLSESQFNFSKDEIEALRGFIHQKFKDTEDELLSKICEIKR